MRLANQVAIVTGAGQGIGQHIAVRLAHEGAVVVIADINEAGSRDTAEMIARGGGAKPVVMPTDITDERQVVALVERTMTIDDRIDILVNNSGIAGPVKDVEDITFDEWEATVAVNLRGTFLCCKYVVPAMKRRRGGSIVNVGSVMGKRPVARRAPYAATKMGVIGLTRGLAMELGPWNIRVNTVCPAQVVGARLERVLAETVKHSGKTREQVIDEKTEGSALHSLVDPEQVAGVVAFLCSSDAAMMTGQDVNVCAGSVMY